MVQVPRCGARRNYDFGNVTSLERDIRNSSLICNRVKDSRLHQRLELKGSSRAGICYPLHGHHPIVITVVRPSVYLHALLEGYAQLEGPRMNNWNWNNVLGS